MYNKDKIFQMTGLSESEFYKKYPTKAHFEKEHGADIFAKGGFMQDNTTKSNQKAFNKAEQMYDDSLALFNSANIDNQWMANIDKTKVSRKDYKAQMQTQDRDALQEAYDRLLRTNNQAPEISSNTLNVLRSDNPKATKELILMNQYKKPTNPPLNPKNFPTKKERDAMDLKQMQLNQQFAEGGLINSLDLKGIGTTAGGLVGSIAGGLGGLAIAGGGAIPTGGASLLAALPAAAAGVGIGGALGSGAGNLAGRAGNGLLKGIGGAKNSFDQLQNSNIFGDGGQLTEVNAGGTHEENPNSGVPVMEGKLVEENETIFDSPKGKYVFSDRMGYADKSKKIEKKYSKRPNDKLSNDSRKRELSALMLEQEAEKANEAQNNEMFDGGGLLNKTDYLNSYIGQPSGSLTNGLVNNFAPLISKPTTTFNQDDNLNSLPFNGVDRVPSMNKLPIQEMPNSVTTGLGKSIDKSSFTPMKRQLLNSPKVTATPNLTKSDLKPPKPINESNFNLKDIDLSILDYLPQGTASLFNIAKGIGSNKQINYKGITPRLMNNNYNLTSSLTNLNNDSAGVNTDIRTNSNLSLAQKISALGSVAANTQKAKAGMINQSNFANMGANNNLINSAKEYNAGVFDRNIDANEMYQDKRAEAIKTGLDTLGTGSSTYIKDKKANEYENANNKMLAGLFKELYPEATKRAKFKFE
jgi:hypothetical protein